MYFKLTIHVQIRRHALLRFVSSVPRLVSLTDPRVLQMPYSKCSRFIVKVILRDMNIIESC